MSEREKFMARLAEDREAGLADLFLFFRPDRAYRPEEIYGAMNAVEEAAKTGLRHSDWKGNDPAPDRTHD